MSLGDDVRQEVAKIFRTQWTRRDGQGVPEPKDIQLGNDAVDLDATILYADLVASTALVRDRTDKYAAEVYKTYLRCACEIIKSLGGSITSFDGDRVMAVFIGDAKSSQAAKAGLQLHYAVSEIVNKEKTAVYGSDGYTVKHVVGIDRSKIMAARTGVRGDNDIVWVGNAANRAAKLCALRIDKPTIISAAVYEHLNEASKLSGGVDMWTAYTWHETNETIYASNYWWKI